MAAHIFFNATTHAGYAPDQVEDQAMTLGELLQAVQEAVEDFGEDAKVILNNGQRYGASFGYFNNNYEGLFTEEGYDGESY